MLLNVYWNKKTGDVLIPTMAKAEAGFWIDVEPVERVTMADPNSLRQALVATLSRSGKVIPTPPPHSSMKPVVLAHANAKTWSAFTRKYEQISVIQSSDHKYTLERYKASPEGHGVVVDIDRRKGFPPNATIEDVVRELSMLPPTNSHKE